MSWYQKVKYDCRHTTYRIEKQQNGRLGLYDLVALYTHLVTCPFCRLYRKQTAVLKKWLRSSFRSNGEATLDSGFKEELMRMIEERL